MLERGQLRMDPERHTCTWKDEPVTLTVTEFLILQALAQRPGVVKSRNALMDAAYDDQVYVDDRTIDSHIKRLRKKFKAADDDFDMIETLYGVGYRFKEALSGLTAGRAAVSVPSPQRGRTSAARQAHERRQTTTDVLDRTAASRTQRRRQLDEPTARAADAADATTLPAGRAARAPPAASRAPGASSSRRASPASRAASSSSTSPAWSRWSSASSISSSSAPA